MCRSRIVTVLTVITSLWCAVPGTSVAAAAAPVTSLTAQVTAAGTAEFAYRTQVPELERQAAAVRSQRLGLTVDGWAARLTGTGGAAVPMSVERFRTDRALAARVAALDATIEQYTEERAARFTELAAAVVFAVGAGDPNRFATVLLGATPRQVQVVLSGLAVLGAPYRFGAAGPSTFDCSGLLHYLAPALPLKAAYQFDALEAAATVFTPNQTARPNVGDLVFFAGGSTAAGPLAIGHVALALPEGIVLHASAAAGAVTLDRLDAMRSPVATAPFPVG
jgi:cell wall-associated NlpC family hydrolase